MDENQVGLPKKESIFNLKKNKNRIRRLDLTMYLNRVNSMEPTLEPVNEDYSPMPFSPELKRPPQDYTLYGRMKQ